MKYYMYVSRSKVEMLSDQLGESSSKTAGSELELDAKVIKYKRQRQETRDSNLYSKLDTVVSRMREHGWIRELSLSSLELEPEYCEDTDRWNSGALFKSYDAERDKGYPASYCVYKDHGDFIVLLVGSLSNVTGQAGAADRWIVSPSWTMDEYLRRVVRDYEDKPKEEKEWGIHEVERGLPGILGFCGNVCSYLPRTNISTLFRIFHIFRLSDDLWEKNLSYYINSIFVGKPRFLVTGSPLFVAIADKVL